MWSQWNGCVSPRLRRRDGGVNRCCRRRVLGTVVAGLEDAFDADTTTQLEAGNNDVLVQRIMTDFFPDADEQFQSMQT